MATTIAVEERTRLLLASLKDEWQARSYDEVILKLIDTAHPVPVSMVGSAPDMPPLTRKERLEMWEGAPGHPARKRRR